MSFPGIIPHSQAGFPCLGYRMPLASQTQRLFSLFYPRSTCFLRQIRAGKILVSVAWWISESHLGWDILQRKKLKENFTEEEFNS